MNKIFLLADDDADDAYLFCEALHQRVPGAVCYTAENGLELFDILAKHNTNKPDVIFLDINMPKMDGWECLKQLKSNAVYHSIPTIMYSTSSAQRDISKAYSLGALLFVSKPEHLSELSKILEVVASSLPDDLADRLVEFHNVKLNRV